MNKALLAAAGLALGVSPVVGQCSYTFSLWEGFRAGQPATVGSKQVAQDAFEFRRDGFDGPLLTAVQANATFNSWGEPTQPFTVPMAGPVFSPDSGLNQSTFYDRVPSFTGIMLHPGYNAITCSAVFTAQTAVTVSSLDLYGEVVGDISDGTTMTLQMVSGVGSVTTLSGPTPVTWSGGAVHTPILPIVPILMHTGDRLVVTSSNAGTPFEDWLIVDLRVNVASAPPVIYAQPRSVALCPGLTAHLIVKAVGATGYQWQREGVDLAGQTGATLDVANLVEADSGRYRCIVSNTCGPNTSAYCTLLVRTADVGSTGGVSGSDGLLDNNDFVVFIDRFFAADARADYGAAGGVPGPDGAFDNNDFVVFIDLFFSGCT